MRVRPISAASWACSSAANWSRGRRRSCIIAADIAADDARTEGSARADLVATSGTDLDTKVTLLVNSGDE